MSTDILTLLGVVIGAAIARGWSRGFTQAEIDYLLPRPTSTNAPTTTELHTS